MTSKVEQNQQAIATLCRKYAVKQLDLFGSAARNDFQAAESDFDFFYEFDTSDSTSLADRFFGLQEELELLLGAKVDLVSAKDAVNPYFLEMANRNRVTLYAA